MVTKGRVYPDWSTAHTHRALGRSRKRLLLPAGGIFRQAPWPEHPTEAQRTQLYLATLVLMTVCGLSLQLAPAPRQLSLSLSVPVLADRTVNAGLCPFLPYLSGA